MSVKLFFQAIFFLGCSVTAGYYLLTSKNGFFAYQKVLLEMDHVMQRNDELERDVQKLQRVVLCLERDSFAREKIVRQDLNMTFTHEIVFLVDAS